jgi:hypothetical protein
MKVNPQKFRLNDARSHKLARLVAALGACSFSAAICNGASPVQDAAEAIWPTKEWQTSTPEEQSMDSKELAKVVDFGAMLGSSLVRDTEFQDRVVAETRALLSTIQA